MPKGAIAMKQEECSKWEIEGWANKVVEAMEILNDPEKMKHVKKHLDSKAKAMKSLEAMRERIAKES